MMRYGDLARKSETPMNTLLANGWPLGLAFVAALVNWYAVARANKHLEYVFKPATLVAVILGAWLLTRGPHDEWQARFFIPGLTFSLAGDVFLMLPGERFFLPGLVSFLLAHLSYIAGLNSTLPPVAPGALLLLVVIAVLGVTLFSRIQAGLRARDQTPLRLPVALYSVVISLMLFSAWATLWRADWSDSRRALVIVGASLFFISDALLAWNKFVRPFAPAQLAIIVTYQLGQLALAASIAR
jgi:alkenylglycerophosphocholine hydrolase